MYSLKSSKQEEEDQAPYISYIRTEKPDTPSMDVVHRRVADNACDDRCSIVSVIDNC